MKFDNEAIDKEEIKLGPLTDAVSNLESKTDLSSKQALVIVLVEKYSLGNESVSNALGMAEGTVRSHRQRAKEKIDKAKQTVAAYIQNVE